MSKPFVPFSKELISATFLERPNRFIIHCKLESNGEVIIAHLADSGRLKELLIPGKKVYLTTSDNPKRKTNYSATLVEREDGLGWVSINTMLPNELAVLAIKHDIFASLSDWEYVRSEYPKGESRWDILLRHQDGRNMIVEVKGASLIKDGIGYFPDAVTSRGAKHVRELADIAQEEGWETALMFVAQRNDITTLKPAVHIDPKFAEAMKTAKNAGVKVIGCRCEVTTEGMEVIDEIIIEVE